MTCQTCAHLDAREALPAARSSVKDWPAMAGLCTKPRGWFNGRLVPVWLSGCPDHSPVALPQGDGDMGDAA